MFSEDDKATGGEISRVELCDSVYDGLSSAGGYETTTFTFCVTCKTQYMLRKNIIRAVYSTSINSYFVFLVKSMGFKHYYTQKQAKSKEFNLKKRTKMFSCL